MAKSKGSDGAKKKGSGENPNNKQIARNRKARHDYEILDTWECGLVLLGSEVKSMRAGRVNMNDAYGDVRDGEVFLLSLHVSPYEQANRNNHEPLRPRKLLMNRREIRKLIGKTTEKGLTLVPLRLYFKNGIAKCELALARGKKSYDKRAAKADADNQRRVQQALRGGIRRRSAED